MKKTMEEELNKPQDVNEELEPLNEGVKISDNGIELYSSCYTAFQLSNLLIQVLKNSDVKKYINDLKAKKKIKQTYTG